MNKLHELSIPLEDFGRDAFKESLKGPDRSMMTEDERAFLAGAILYTKPINILEIGVQTGGGSLLALELIKSRPNAHLTSIDIAKEIKSPGKGWQNIPIGADVINAYNNLESANAHPQWTLITGRDTSEVIDGLSKKFDFVILDTAHIAPIEALNFLTVLPFLTEDAVVVMHDMGQQFLHYFAAFPRLFIGNKLLLDNIIAETKIYLNYSEYNNYNPYIMSNIVAMQLNADTRKYIGNVFSGLNFPWGTDPENIIEHVTKIIEKYYKQPEIRIFKNSILRNRSIIENNFRSTPNFDFALRDIKLKFKNYHNYILFGVNSLYPFLIYNRQLGSLPSPIEIWDNLSEKKELYGIPINKPHTNIPENTLIIITARQKKSITDIIKSIHFSLRKSIVILEDYAPYKELL